MAFAKMALAGFGGVLVWARRGVVDQHRWMTARSGERSRCAISCRGRTSICRSCSARSPRHCRRHRGLCRAGRAADGDRNHLRHAVCYGEIDVLRRILAGVSCAAVGLLISVVFKMMMPLIKSATRSGSSFSWRCSSRSDGAAAAAGVLLWRPAQPQHHLFLRWRVNA